MIVWDYTSKRPLYRLMGITQQVLAMSFSPDERFLCAAGGDKMLFVWDMEVRCTCVLPCTTVWYCTAIPDVEGCECESPRDR